MVQVLMLFLLAAQPEQLRQDPSSCVVCHKELGGALAEPATLAASDIHALKGLSCHDCHGGDPSVGVDRGSMEDAMDPRKGYIGVPQRRQIAGLCARCHSKLDFMRRYNPKARVDQYEEYVTSTHGRKYLAGDANVATCTDCHGAHGIRMVSDPNSRVYPTNVADTCARCHSDPQRMRDYKLPTDQLKLYAASVHGVAVLEKRDISAPTCNDCHGNHGATPPGVDAVSNVCGQCHVMQSTLFEQSRHKAAFAEAGFPACVTCHEHHAVRATSDAMLGVEESASCIQCHEQGSAGYAAAASMKDGIVGLQGKIDTARGVLDRAARAGMEVSRPIYSLSEARDLLIRARVEIHRFDPEALANLLKQGEKVALDAGQSGRRALEELAFRRKGMAVSAVIIVFMIGLLLVKIRQLAK